jgi:hypothetical protein
VSKYIGETEKNLARLFDAAEGGGCILLFDEADALFGKRSEVRDSHDRYANIEVSYLLQRMEAFDGLAILTTNLRGALDPAFMRRIRFAVQFPFPDAEARAAIWRGIFPAATPLDGIDAEWLARLSVAGGSIRNIALQAAFLAADAHDVARLPPPAAAAPPVQPLFDSLRGKAPAYDPYAPRPKEPTAEEKAASQRKRTRLVSGLGALGGAATVAAGIATLNPLLVGAGTAGLVAGGRGLAGSYLGEYKEGQAKKKETARVTSARAKAAEKVAARRDAVAARAAEQRAAAKPAGGARAAREAGGGMGGAWAAAKQKVAADRAEAVAPAAAPAPRELAAEAPDEGPAAGPSELEQQMAVRRRGDVPAARGERRAKRDLRRALRKRKGDHARRHRAEERAEKRGGVAAKRAEADERRRPLEARRAARRDASREDAGGADS